MTLTTERKRELTAQFGASETDTGSTKVQIAQLTVTIPQLSDFEPKGATCRAFGVLHEGGFAERALVIVDRDGIVRFSRVEATPGEIPGVNVLFDGLATV